MSLPRGRAVVPLAIALAFTQCAQRAPAPAAHVVFDGAVAKVGSLVIPPSLVAAVAEAKSVTPATALDELIGDALAAQGAEARGFARDPAVSWQRTVALAEGVPARLAEEARALGPPTNDELSTLLVVHALVMRSPTLREEDALAIARAIRGAVVGARTIDDFLSRAQVVAHPHAKVIAQQVGPFAADGIEPSGGELDAGFVAASFVLHRPGDTSPIVATPFGWHVIQLVERTLPGAEFTAARREALAGPIQLLRGRMRLDDAIRMARSRLPVELAVAADAMMARATALP